MNYPRRSVSFFAAALTFFLAALTPDIVSADSPIATLYSLEGTAERKLASGGNWQACAVGEQFALGDEIRVGSYSRAGIQFEDGLFVRLSSKASLRFDRAKSGSPGNAVNLQSGKGHFFNRERIENTSIETAVVSAAIRGTEVVVEALTDSAVISVIEGAVDAYNDHGAVRLASGEQASTRKGSAPQKSLTFTPADAVQWTAEVPVVLDWGLYGRMPGLEAAASRIESRAASQGLAAALMDARKLPRSAGRALIETDLLIALGQIDEARAALSGATLDGVADEVSAHAHSQRALLALARNDDDSARADIGVALAKHAGGSGVSMAASLVFQGEKNLAQALDAVERGLEANPRNAALLARKAELQLGYGKQDEALASAEAALAVDPSNGYAHSVVGFIRLMQGQADSARESFERAHRENPGSGLPFLGRGLALIHDGDLEAGKIDLQRAVHLEPNRAVFRSYLGKAFFELEDETLAKREFDEAIRLDPNDPTSYLYRGFYHISQNRLVAALEDIETSFALNGNRAVFRSSLLLDDDSAVRSAGLSRVFTELGFAEAGRIEAIQALNADPTNFSAHRLLADSQTSIFYADATLSERRIADLLAPISFNLFSALGGRASLNEYDSLFDQALRRTGLTFEYDGRSDAFIGQVTHSGKSDNLGYAMAATTTYAHGRKKSSYLRDHRIDGALRYQLLPNHRILMDAHGFYRKDHVEFDEDSEDTTQFDVGGINLGYSYRAGPNLTLLAEAAFSRERLLMSSFPVDRSIDSTLIFEGIEDTLIDDLFLDQQTKEYISVFRNGAQALYRSDVLSLVGGYQLLHETPSRSERSLVVDDSLGELTDQGLELASRSSPDLTASDVYLYPTFHVLPWLDLTAGITRTDLETSREVAPFFAETDSQGRWNPKIGVTVNPAEGLTLRGAYFETLRKSSLEDQVSLEPTLVSGITQRFNDLSGTRSRNLGIGANYKIPRSTYIGGEYIRRNLVERLAEAHTTLVTDLDFEEQYLELEQSSIDDAHVEQQLARAYVYQVLSPSLTASADYLYSTEKLTAFEPSSDFKAHRTALQLKYFHPSGLFAFSRATWRKQTGLAAIELDDDEENAWMFDAGLGYRLPNRRGTITFEILNLADKDTSFDQSGGFEDYIASERAFRVSAAVNF